MPLETTPKLCLASLSSARMACNVGRSYAEAYMVTKWRGRVHHEASASGSSCATSVTTRRSLSAAERFLACASTCASSAAPIRTPG